MNITSALVLYVVLWFLILFVILPIGQKSQAEAGEVVPGTPPGAPHEPKLKKKALLTTVLAAVAWALIAWIIFGDIITRADINAIFG